MTKLPQYPLANQVVKKKFATIQESLDWANELPDKTVPGLKPNTNLFVSQVEQFQIIMHDGESCTIVVLVSIYLLADRSQRPCPSQLT